MKKSGFTLTSMLAAVAVIGMLAVIVATPSQAGWPAEKVLTLPGGGTGTNIVSSQYAEGIGQAIYTSFKVRMLTIEFDSAAAAAATVTLSNSVGGPAIHTAVVASNGTAKVSFETNDWSVLRDQYFYLNCTSTNTGTVTILGDEQ